MNATKDEASMILVSVTSEDIQILYMWTHTHKHTHTHLPDCGLVFFRAFSFLNFGTLRNMPLRLFLFPYSRELSCLTQNERSVSDSRSCKILTSHVLVYYTCTLLLKSLGAERFCHFLEKERNLFCSQFIWPKISNIVKYVYYLKKLFYFNIFSNAIYSCDVKLNFLHHYSSLQCHMILQKSISCLIFLWKLWYIFWGFVLSTEQHLFIKINIL